jgi:hypothetical protein
MGVKVVKVSILKILEFALRNPRTKRNLSANIMPKHREYYKGEGAGILKFGPW